jgi:hypothetical protein
VIRTRHKFSSDRGVSEVTVIVCSADEWDASAESHELYWSVNRGDPLVAVRLVTPFIPSAAAGAPDRALGTHVDVARHPSD